MATDAAAVDPHSYAEPDRFVVRHASLDLRADFDARRLEGSIELELERRAPDATELVLDSRDLEIRRVGLVAADGSLTDLRYVVGPADRVLGQPIRIALPPGGSAEPRVRVDYATGTASRALQWLVPEQTAGRAHPFVYTKSQPIDARAWLPIQDSPGIRFTYDARIRVPSGLRAVMSAAPESQRTADGVYRFEMPQPIPAYLVALAIGDLDFRALGPRTGIHAEPVTLAAAAHEFADLERMVTQTEALFGPYRWGRYDLLIMPPSFPVGGMENPRVSFITPTVIAGDRSLVSLITHELAHSWAGNLVTNAHWGDFWLNEGVTTYLERRILEGLYGRERAARELVLGRQDLEEEVARLVSEGRPGNTALALDLRGRSPREELGNVAYEKGSLFLQFLESRVGRAALDRWLAGYFDDFAFRSVTTPEFEAHLRKRLLAQSPARVSDAELREWLHGTGIPSSAPPAPTGVFAAVEQAQAAWLAGRVGTADLPSGAWSPQEWRRFLDTLPDDLTDERLGELERHGRLGTPGNYEIARSWLLLAVRSDYRAAEPQLEAFLVGTGRHRMIENLYRALAATPERHAVGCRIYARARPGYHPSMQAMVDRLLGECRSAQ